MTITWQRPTSRRGLTPSCLWPAAILALAALALAVPGFGEGTLPAAVAPAATKPAADIAGALVGLGLENVAVSWQHNGHLNVAFENRTYRSDATAMGQALATLAGMLDARTYVNVTPLRDRVVLGRYGLTLGSYGQFAAGKLSADQMTEELEADQDMWEFESPLSSREHTARLNPSALRVDLMVQPALEYRIGAEVDPFISTRLLRPELRATLGKGLRGNVRGRIEVAREGWSVDQALLTKTDRLGDRNALWTASVGKFRHSRYGGFVEGQLADGQDKLRVGARGALLGGQFGDDDFKSYTGYVEQEFGNFGLTARASYGRFLGLEEEGVLVDLERRFGESTLRIGGTTGFDKDRFMVQLATPLGPRKVSDPARLRPRVNPAVLFDYESTGFPAGDAMWDAPDLRSFRGEMTLPYMKEHPERLLGEARRAADADEWQVATSFEGLSGLIRIPTADIVPDAHWVLGASWMPKHQTSGLWRDQSQSLPAYVTIGFLPNLEVSFRLTFYDDVQAAFDGVVADWPYDLDRSGSAQLRLCEQKDWRPAVALGVQDIKFGDDSSKVGRTKYLVATHQIDNFRAHLGFGEERYGGWFGGVEARLHEHVKLMGEYDTEHTNLGVRLQSNGITLDAAWLDTEDFGAALSYRGAFQ